MPDDVHRCSRPAADLPMVRGEDFGYVVGDEVDVAVGRHPFAPDGVRLSVISQGGVCEFDVAVAGAVELARVLLIAAEHASRLTAAS
ncbi:MAG: hypothetical protein QOE89_2187 [Pseudonocardiales bacterium]|jgi:hypothetical protein|nr:hypothetical protein [Pseudonocardiales bacterium]